MRMSQLDGAVVHGAVATPMPNSLGALGRVVAKAGVSAHLRALDQKLLALGARLFLLGEPLRREAPPRPGRARLRIATRSRNGDQRTRWKYARRWCNTRTTRTLGAATR